MPGGRPESRGENLYLLKSGKGVPNALYRTATLGGALERLAGDVDSLPAISPDRKTLAFMRGLPDQNEPGQITTWKSDRLYWFDISPDGKTIARARGTSQSDAVLITQTSEPK